MRKLVLSILAVITILSLSVPAFSQGGRQQRPPSPPARGRVAPRPPQPQSRQVPLPPQRYMPNQREYQRQYNYNGRWFPRAPSPYQSRLPYNRGFRVVVCQPGYVVFVGYDYHGMPIFEFYRGYCNVPNHYHSRSFYDGY